MDLARFLTHSKKVETDDLDWQLAARVGLTDDEARLLGHAADIEGQTPFYVRELMNTPARYQADTVGFLTIWGYEEYFHAQAIHRLLAACGRADRAIDVSTTRRRVTARAWIEEIAQGMLARFATEAFTALYFTWGASQEYLTTHAYQTMAANTANPVFATLARRIAKQERRHYAWYLAGAREHLERSPLGQRLTRAVLDRVWTPVGVGVKSEADTALATRALFGGRHEELFTAMQAKIAALPGLAGVTGIVRYAERVSRELAAAETPLRAAA